MRQGEVTFTYSGILSRDGKKVIHVRFEREGQEGKDYAEGVLPSCRIERSKGFTPNELEQMTAYLQREKEHIIQDAKKLNNLKNWF